MEIREIIKDKNKFLELLLIGDEDKVMVYKYLDTCRLFALYKGSVELASICAVIKIDSDTVEIKNLATYPQYQNLGYASELLNFIFKKYKKIYKYVILGTGENKKTLEFYNKRGFEETHRIKNFFINNYQKPIIENGNQLTDMIYLRKEL